MSVTIQWGVLLKKVLSEQGRSQDFLKGSSNSSMELPEAGVWQSPAVEKLLMNVKTE